MSPAPYSYRSDPAVPPFDDRAPLVIFDGLCVLCASGVRWMLKRDGQGTSRFAVIQDAIPQALYRHYNLDPAAFDTFMVLIDGRPHVRWAGAIAAARTMPPPWRWLAALGALVPRVIGDMIYDWVQRNRIAWFGGRDACYAPAPGDRLRFLDGAAAAWLKRAT